MNLKSGCDRSPRHTNSHQRATRSFHLPQQKKATMTTSPSQEPRTPCPAQDKENKTETPFVNLPSALKLGTPFFRGTRRHREGIPTQTTESPSTKEETPLKSLSFPDELPLNTFRERLSPRQLQKGKKETSHKGDKSIVTTSDSAVSPNDKHKEVRWDLPDATSASSPLLEDEMHTSKPSYGQLEECVQDLNDAEASDDFSAQEVWENEHELTPTKSYAAADDEINFLSSDDSLLEIKPQIDDYSIMIDAMAADFQEEIAAEQQILKRLSLGDTTGETSVFESKTSFDSNRIQVLEAELRSQRHAYEQLEMKLKEERDELLSQMKEIESHAKLSVRLAREEAKQRVEDERHLLIVNCEEADMQQQQAIAEAGKQAAGLIKEHHKHQNDMRILVEKIRADHKLEMEKALEQAREDAKKSAEASLAIQKAAVTQSLQREIFDIETELLETLDELETTKENHKIEKQKLEARILALQQELEEEQEKTRNANEDLQKEVEMFRVRLEVERQNGICKAEEVSTHDSSTMELRKHIEQLEKVLCESKQEIESLKEDRKKQVFELEMELSRLKEQGCPNASRKDKDYDRLESDYKQLKSLVQDYIATLDFLNGNACTIEGAPDVERLRQKMAQIQENTLNHQDATGMDRCSLDNRSDSVENNIERITPSRRPKIVDAVEQLRWKFNTQQQKLSTIPLCSECVTPIAQKPPVQINVNHSTFTKFANPKVLEVSKDSAFVEPKPNAFGSLSGRKNPTAKVLQNQAQFCDSTNNVEKTAVLQSPIKNSTCSMVQTFASKKELVSSESTSGKGDGSSERDQSEDNKCNSQRDSSANQQSGCKRSATENKLGKTRSLVPPRKETNITTPSTNERSSKCSRVPSQLVSDSAKKVAAASRPGIPRRTSVSKSSIPSRKSYIGETKPIERSQIPQTKRSGIASRNRVGKLPPSQACSRRSSLQEPRSIARGSTPSRNIVPSSEATQLSQTKPVSRPRPSMIAERSTRQVSQTNKKSNPSGIPRANSKSTIGVSRNIPISSARRDRLSLQTTQRTIESSVFSGRSQRECTSQDHSLLITPVRNRNLTSSNLRTPSEPSSQQVREKFSSLCNTWSKTKTAKDDESREDLPPSLQLDLRFVDSMVESTTPLSKNESQSESTTRRSTCDLPANEGLVSDEEDLLLSPIPQLAPKKIGSIKNIVGSIIYVQSHVRTFLAQKKYREKRKMELVMSEKAVIIQSFVRGACLRKLLKRRARSAQIIISWVQSRNLQKRIIQRKLRKDASTIIQSHWRRYKQLLDYTRNVHAAIKLQKYVRRKRALVLLRNRRIERLDYRATQIQAHFRRFLSAKLVSGIRKIQSESAIAIQSIWRRTFAQKSYRRLHKSACLIQCFFRQTVAKDLLMRKKSVRKAILIQATWRRRRIVALIHKRRQSIHVLQRAARSYLLKKNQLKVLKNTERAITIVQACHRGRTTRSELRHRAESATVLQSRWRKRQAKQDFCKLIKGIVRLQLLFRKKSGQQKTNLAVVVVQSWVRRFICERRFRYIQMIFTRLQSNWRGHVARLAQEQKRKAIVKLQSWIRKQTLVVYRTTAISSAIQIQTCWRAYTAQSIFNSAKFSAVRIQTSFRCWVSRKQYLNQRKRQTNTAALIIQSWVRARTAITRYSKMKNAAILIQTSWRARIYLFKYRTILFGLTKLQASWKAAVGFRRYEIVRSGMILCQAKFRARIASRIYNERIEKIVLLQKMGRRMIQRQRFFQLKIASVTLQKVLRMHLQSQLYKRIIRAVIQMQKLARKRLVVSQLGKKKLSATFIQRNWRAKLERRRFQSSRKGIIFLQSLIRKRITRREFIAIKKKIIRIQARIRQSSANYRYQCLRYAVITIQTKWRSQRQLIERNRMNKAVVRIQSWVRTNISRKEYISKKKAAVHLQSLAKMRLQQKHFHLAKEGAIKLQSFVRALSAAKIFSSMKDGAVKIQRLARCFLERQNFLRLKQAVLVCQRRRRIHVEIVKTRMTLEEQEKAARTLQKYFRMSVQCKRYKILRFSCIVIQTGLRRYLTWKRYELVRNFIVKLQSFWRAYKEQKVFARRTQSAVLLQSIWRTKICISYYRKSLCHVTTIQAWTRGWIVQNGFNKKRDAALSIQRFWKGYKIRKNLQVRSKAACAIQSLWRSRNAMSLYKKFSNAIVLIQSRYRSKVSRKYYLSEMAVIINLQRAAKRNLYRRRRKRIFKGITLFQAKLRMHLASKEFDKQRYAALTIQAAARRLLARAKFLEHKKSFQTECDAVSRIQSAVRGHLVRMKYRSVFQKRFDAMIKIQSAVRRLLSRKSFLTFLKEKAKRDDLQRKVDAATKIQAAARRQLARTRHLTCLQNKSVDVPGLPLIGVEMKKTTDTSRMPLVAIENEQSKQRYLQQNDCSTSRKPLGNVTTSRRPLGDISSVFSPVKTNLLTSQVYH